METEEEESGGDVEILHKEGDVDKSLEPAIIRRINQMIKENEKRKERVKLAMMMTLLLLIEGDLND